MTLCERADNQLLNGGLSEVDQVRIDIPDQTDPDHQTFHGKEGEIISIHTDDAHQETGDIRDAAIYRVNLNEGPTIDFRWRDLRPSIEEA